MGVHALLVGTKKEEYPKALLQFVIGRLRFPARKLVSDVASGLVDNKTTGPYTVYADTP